MARRTSILTLHIGNRRISYHAEKNRSNSSVSNTGLRFGDCLCNVSFFFNPYFPLTNTYERQICSLRHTLILYSIQFFLDCMEFFLAQRYNPQIQIAAESGTKRSIFRQKNKTKRSKNRLHTTLIKPEQKVNEDLCSGFVLS